MKRFFLIVCGIGAATFFSMAAPVKIELPRETEVFKHDTGAEIANGQCLICHSVEYVSTQPKKDRVFWAASVKKMQDKYGAPISQEQVEPLLDYITKNYGVVDTNAPSTNPVTQVVAASSADGVKIATKYGCLTCHNVSAKIIGPSYREIAAKYKTDPAAVAKVEEQIQKGGSGKWGPVVMPPFSQISASERKVLAEWILGQK
jgi:cytochrome c